MKQSERLEQQREDLKERLAQTEAERALALKLEVLAAPATIAEMGAGYHWVLHKAHGLHLVKVNDADSLWAFPCGVEEGWTADQFEYLGPVAPFNADVRKSR